MAELNLPAPVAPELNLAGSIKAASRWGWLLLASTVVALIVFVTVGMIEGAVVSGGMVKVDLNRKQIQHQEGGIVRAPLQLHGDGAALVAEPGLQPAGVLEQQLEGLAHRRHQQREAARQAGQRGGRGGAAFQVGPLRQVGALAGAAPGQCDPVHQVRVAAARGHQHHQAGLPRAFVLGTQAHLGPDDEPHLQPLGFHVLLGSDFPAMAQNQRRNLEEARIGKLPNEDAQSFVFDDSALFDWDKFSGYDRIETGTFLVAAAVTGGRLTLENAPAVADICRQYHEYLVLMTELDLEVARQARADWQIEPETLNVALTVGGGALAGAGIRQRRQWLLGRLALEAGPALRVTA